jgi:cytochrome bd-type quinol oxidase subunit 2
MTFDLAPFGVIVPMLIAAFTSAFGISTTYGKKTEEETESKSRLAGALSWIAMAASLSIALWQTADILRAMGRKSSTIPGHLFVTAVLALLLVVAALAVLAVRNSRRGRWKASQRALFETPNPNASP